MTTTATEKSMQDHEDERDDHTLNSIVRNFTKRYEPEDRRDRLDFEMALHQLVRAIYREAAKPYDSILRASVQHMSLQSFVPGKDAKP